MKNMGEMKGICINLTCLNDLCWVDKYVDILGR